MIKRPEWLDDDTLDLFHLFQEHGVRYLIVGGIAVIYHGYTRNTNDADIFFEQSDENTLNLFEALKKFWGGEVPAINDREELNEQEVFFQFGREPNRVDLMGTIPGIEFKKAWKNRIEETLDTDPPLEIFFISKQDLIEAKEAANRPIDRADLEYLRESEN